tara:strand:- start:284 stop:589 length:306 start_codon:yes stop_codon:yes gene_type:complete
MRKWEDMLRKTELWTSYNIVFPTTDKGIICQGIIDGIKVPSIIKASELLYKKYYIMKMAINFIFDLLETQVNKIINKKLKQLEEKDEMLKVQESMLEKLKT